MLILKSSFLLYLILQCFSVCISAGPHSHKQPGSKERESDGSFIAKDSNHYKDGQHHNEFDHEAILGSYDKAEEFDHLPPEESKRRLKLLAIKMDANKDGYVDSKELTDWVTKSFIMLTKEEAMEMMEEEDKNQDGKVSWEEHIDGMVKDEFELNDLDGLHEEKNQDQELFKAADLNKDGFLDQNEYPLFSHPEEFEEMHETLTIQTLAKKDLNRDGYIDLKEFLTEPGDRTYQEEDILAEKDRFLHDYDFDKDGKLNRYEIVRWLVPNSTEIAEQEVTHLFQSSDEDNDGKLSLEEIVDNHDVFVGSEATDYGDHLYRIKEEL